MVNGEWFKGDDSGHESIVEFPAIVTSDADACASIPCVVGERAGGQSPTKVLLAHHPTPSLLCESISKLASVAF